MPDQDDVPQRMVWKRRAEQDKRDENVADAVRRQASAAERGNIIAIVALVVSVVALVMSLMAYFRETG